MKTIILTIFSVLFVITAIIFLALGIAWNNTTCNYSYRKEKYCNHNFPIDVVFTWVDSSDSNWLEKKKRFTGKGISNSSFDLKRFGSCGISQIEIEISVRLVLKNMPWVRKIWVVVDNQMPDFLSSNFLHNKKVEVINHQSFFKSALPTFNSHAIEANIVNIPGLSERFIYMNDDFYVTRRVEPSDFFYGDGIPCYRGYNMINVRHNVFGRYIDRFFNSFNKDSILFMRASSNLCDPKKLFFFRQNHNACPLTRESLYATSNFYGYSRLRSEKDYPPIHCAVLWTLRNKKGLLSERCDRYRSCYIDSYSGGKVNTNNHELCINYIKNLDSAKQFKSLIFNH